MIYFFIIIIIADPSDAIIQGRFFAASTGTVVGLVVGIGIALIILIGIVAYAWRRSKTHSQALEGAREQS